MFSCGTQPRTRASNSGIRLSIAARINGTCAASIVEDDSARTLNMQKEDGDCIIGIEQHRRIRQTLRVNLGACCIRNKLVALQLARNTFAFQRLAKQSQIDADKIGRQAINGYDMNHAASGHREFPVRNSR